MRGKEKIKEEELLELEDDNQPEKEEQVSEFEESETDEEEDEGIPRLKPVFVRKK